MSIEKKLSQLQECATEEEVKHEFAEIFRFRLDTRDRIDLYTDAILFEFKYDVNMNSVVSRAKVTAQMLYYIRRLKYGSDPRTPSPWLCGVDKNEAFIIETSTLSAFFLESKKARKYDWDRKPSMPDHKLVKELCNCKIIHDAFVYQFSDNEGASEFARQIDLRRNWEQISLFGNKKNINESNFYDIFLLWNKMFEDYVENGRKSSEYFMTDIEQGRTSVVENKQVLFRLNSGENITKYMPMSKYNHFWNTYERLTDIRQIEAIRQRMDRMTEINLRRFTGEFYTPLTFAEKAIDYIGRVIRKKNWWLTGEYRLWDMAAGTGNLEYQLPVEALKYCYISTLLDDDAQYCRSIFPEATVFQYDYLNDDIHILLHPDLLDKGVAYKLPKKLVDDINNPDIKWILFFNPPYATSNNNERDKKKINKDSVSMTRIQKVMTDDGLGEVSRELMSQFLYRINMEFQDKNALIAMFSKIKFMNAPNDQKMRDQFFNFMFKRGFLFSSKNFDGCSARFPVGFTIWSTTKRKSLEKQKIELDVYDEHIEKVGTKQIKPERRTAFLSEWIVRERGVDRLPPFSSAISISVGNKDVRNRVADGFLCSFMCGGNDYAHQNNTTLLSGPQVSAGALSVTPRNFEKAMIIFTVRRLPRATWLNDRDQMMQADGEVLADEEFVSDCVVWALFSRDNSTASLTDVKYEGKAYRIKNELFPFLIEQIRKWDYGHADFRVQASAKHTNRYAAKWLHNRKLSKEAKTVMKEAERVYRFFYAHLDELPYLKYKIRKWDVGWWQIHKALNDARIGLDEQERLKVAHKQLGKKLLNRIYEYRFIEPDMIPLDEYVETNDG